MRYCKWFSAGNRGSLLYRRNRRSAWRSDRFVDPAESNNRSANRNVDDLNQSSTDGGILDSARTIKNSKNSQDSFDLQCDHRSGSDTIFAGIYREPVYGMHYWRCLGWDRDGNRFYEWIYNGRK